jgi:hypothetical protein
MVSVGAVNVFAEYRTSTLSSALAMKVTNARWVGWAMAAVTGATGCRKRPGGMLAMVVTGDLPTPGRAVCIGEVLSGLPGRCGNGEIFAWTDAGDAGMLPAVLFARISRAGLFEDWPAGVGIDAACDPAGLMTRLWEIDEAAATGALAGLASVSMAYRVPGRYTGRQALQVFGALAGMLGQQARRWSSTAPSGSNPVTCHTFDALIAGVGCGVIVTILACDED